jgi:dihydroneopterin aldolase
MSRDGVLIHGLEVNCVIGILPEERGRTQPLRFHLDLGADFGRIRHPRDYDHIVDYAAISSLVRERALVGEYLLLETLAEDLCTEIFQRFPVLSIRLTIEKPEAVETADWVGIRVHRTRP